jgi:OOP family OmpA-OmpF porin
MRFGKARSFITWVLVYGTPVLVCAPVCAAQDAKGCKDSPLISRFPGSRIDSCSDKQDDMATVRTAKQNRQIEGEVHKIYYILPSGSSQAQLLRNLKTALATAGYSMDWDSGNGDLTYHKGGTWVVESSNMGGTFYNQTIVVETRLKQEIVADAKALSNGLDGNGHVVANGIHFDTGKAVVKADSAPALQEIARLLEQNPALKLYVVGHTDNAGTLTANLELSRQRAAAVVEALTTQYHIAAGRLQPYGDGPYAPIASNDSEDGRALNRRVELVKQ